MAAIVVELEGRGSDFKAVSALHKTPPVRSAPEFAVGHDIEPDPFLQPNHVADGLIEDTTEFRCVDLVRVTAFECVA